MSSSKVLFFMSGSIAAFKACQVISRLVQDGCEVQVVATPSTFNFIGAATFEGLTGKKVLSDLWERGHAMDHIHLSRWADYGVLCPASANTIAKVAHGMTDDLVTAMILAWPAEKPLTVVPAMNHQMLTAAVTQENLAKLSARGLRVSATQSGSLACGEEGQGRMLEAEDILKLLRAPSLGKVLVTGGATREPIDGIRFISNVSTGQTAAALTDQLATLGYDVTYLHGASAIQPARAVKRLEYGRFTELDSRLREELGTHEYSAVIHCAAVSDYSVDGAAPDVKLATTDQLNLKLKANFKILPRLKEYSRAKDIQVIGFKLTLGTSDAEGQARAALTSGVDAIVLNDWAAVQADRSRHPGKVLTKGEGTQAFTDLPTLAKILHERLRSTL